jgi:AraC family ethanolamine operon transcriptional activator
MDGLNIDFTPLVRKISAEQVIINLGGCDIYFVRSFPRILDVQLAPNCTAVGFTMEDGAPIRFNGVEWPDPMIAIGGDGAAYTAVERGTRRYVSIVFTPSVKDRGWPQVGPSFQVLQATPASQHRLRELMIQILVVTGKADDSILVSDASFAIRESLLSCIDGVFAEIVPSKWIARANSIRQFKTFQDIQAVLAGSLGQPIYSEDIAREVGISVRTMHDTILRYCGMSLHRYLRLRRLWLVRRQLLAGADSVKATALAFGFWHLGDFSASYRLQFGETPSETLARSRRA